MSDLDRALWLRDLEMGLSDAERDFVVNAVKILSLGQFFSKKQQRWLNAIFLAMGGKNG